MAKNIKTAKVEKYKVPDGGVSLYMMTLLPILLFIRVTCFMYGKGYKSCTGYNLRQKNFPVKKKAISFEMAPLYF